MAQSDLGKLLSGFQWTKNMALLMSLIISLSIFWIANPMVMVQLRWDEQLWESPSFHWP